VATIRRPANGPSPDIMTGHGQHVALTLRLRYREGEGSLTHPGEFGDVGATLTRRRSGVAWRLRDADWRFIGYRW